MMISNDICEFLQLDEEAQCKRQRGEAGALVWMLVCVGLIEATELEEPPPAEGP